MDPISIALGLAQFVPGIVKWVTGSEKDKAVAEKIVGLAKAVTGTNEEAAAAQAIAANPQLALQMRQELDRHEEELQRIAASAALDQRKQDLAERQADSSDIAAINATMLEEVRASSSESWYQKAWRPFNGFVVGFASLLATLFVCVLFYRALASHELGNNVVAVINVIPQLASSLAMILAIPGAAVGIAAWHRGIKQVREVSGDGK